ncbi:alpha-N-acetylgalactosaminide alpha-2,6-sialyltransferase 5-like isoform X1 [Hippocampus zosterae]|uniref:alpha-N-acetylgalactosaminide alpha-2,6-sialyltransferase 5-like isoform X1 n=1 Tax=Hippocampus zosterae TaxID=109293 RepID=UPI00223E427D|nr:alpha-N-acetylgalactosaminide alpha-2,6-sialyltransferase 5-like isoform X1 [Hippocampus zosterae]
MRIRLCQGVGSIIVVTMVTSLMVAYNRRARGGRSSSAFSPPSSASSSRQKEGPAPAVRKRSQTALVATLGGYTAVEDCKALRMHCRTCALVTSSGQLTGGERGPEIDGSKCVIRMNDAPSVGYERDVGRRTSLRVVAHSSLQRVLRRQRELLNASQGTVFVFWGPSSCMKRDGRGHVYNHLKMLNQQLPGLHVYIISRLKMMAFDELFKNETGVDRKSSNSWLSTGWFTMAMARELCDRINVYGMVPPDQCSAISLLRAFWPLRVRHVPVPREKPARESPPFHHREDGLCKLGSQPRHPFLPAGLEASSGSKYLQRHSDWILNSLRINR